MEWKGRSSAAVTATPMMSKMMPIRMKQTSTTKAMAKSAPSSASSEAKDSTAERTTEMQNTWMGQRNRPGFFSFFSSLFFPFFSGFFLLLSPVSKQYSPHFLFLFDVCPPAAKRDVRVLLNLPYAELRHLLEIRPVGGEIVAVVPGKVPAGQEQGPQEGPGPVLVLACAGDGETAVQAERTAGPHPEPP